MHFNFRANNLNRKIFVFFMTLIIVLFAFGLSGCNNNLGEEEATPTPTATTTASSTPKPALIRNGSFEETYDTSYPKTPKYWSSNGDNFGGSTAPLADAKYGIISTETESFNENKATYGDIENPLTPTGSEDSNIIMIYNKKPTASKYKSQSISLPINSYAKISVFVKTLNIKPYDESSASSYSHYGASINLSGMDEDIHINGIASDTWKEYTIYLESSSVAAKTLYIELGLGAGSPADSRGYTSGHAFFDSVKMDYISKADYEKAIFGQISNDPIVEIVSNNPVYTSNNDRFFYYDNDKFDTNNYDVNRLDMRSSVYTEFAYSYKNRDNIVTKNADTLSLTNIPVDTADYISSISEYVTPNGKKINVSNYSAELTNYPFLTEELSAYPFNSTSVFAMYNSIYGTQGYKTADETIKAHSEANNDIYLSYSYYRIGVFVKTSDFINNGFNVYLVKEDANGSLHSKFENINTGSTNLSQEDLEEDANIHNKWDNWVEYVFYAEASPYEDVNVHLEFWLGPDTVTNKQSHSFTKGYAMISEMSVQRLTSSEYSSATAGATVVSGLKLENYNDKTASTPQIANSGFNTSTETAILNKPVNPSSWTGYFGGYSSLVGDDESVLVANHSPNDVVSGIINKNYLDAYKTNNYIDNSIDASTLDNGAPVGAPNYLMIYNKTNTAYGYVSPTKTLSANSYYVFNIMAKTYNGANAAIYITDNDGKILEIEGDSVSAGYVGLTPAVWTKYSFYIKTGELSKTVKIELWNGARDGLAANTSTGYALYDDVYMNTVEKSVFETITASTVIKKLDFEGVDIAPTATPTPTPTATPTPTPEPQPEAVPFGWDTITMLLIALVLVFVLIVYTVRKIKKSKFFKPRKIRKVEKPSYSRDKLKFNNKKTKETIDTTFSAIDETSDDIYNGEDETVETEDGEEEQSEPQPTQDNTDEAELADDTNDEDKEDK